MGVITDPIADLLTRIRNANNVNHQTVDVPASKMKKAVMRARKDRPVGGRERSGPRCVPSRSNSTITASSAWRSETSSLRWSGNALRVSA